MFNVQFGLWLAEWRETRETELANANWYASRQILIFPGILANVTLVFNVILLYKNIIYSRTVQVKNVPVNAKYIFYKCDLTKILLPLLTCNRNLEQRVMLIDMLTVN